MMSEKPQGPLVSLNSESLNHHLVSLFGRPAKQTRLEDIGLTLLLLDDDDSSDQFAPEQVDTIWQNMPYWAFVWSSGRALASFVQDHPTTVAGKRILDFGAGSGVVGLAALNAGAAEVTCCDIDPLSRQACLDNARLNQLNLQVVSAIEDAGDFDLLVVGDILYDTRNHGLAHSLFQQQKPLLWAESQAQTKLADQRPVAIYSGETYPNVGGFDEHKRIHIYHHSPV